MSDKSEGKGDKMSPEDMVILMVNRSFCCHVPPLPSGFSHFTCHYIRFSSYNRVTP